MQNASQFQAACLGSIAHVLEVTTAWLYIGTLCLYPAPPQLIFTRDCAVGRELNQDDTEKPKKLFLD